MYNNCPYGKYFSQNAPTKSYVIQLKKARYYIIENILINLNSTIQVRKESSISKWMIFSLRNFIEINFILQLNEIGSKYCGRNCDKIVMYNSLKRTLGDMPQTNYV